MNEKEFKALWSRYENANKYFDNENIPNSEKELYLPEYRKILLEISKYKLKQKEVLENGKCNR